MAVERTNVTLHIPTLEELWFRQRMLEDLETMAYNHAWGGTIPWPREEWKPWFEYWIEHPGQKRFYRYLKDEDTGSFVGENVNAGAPAGGGRASGCGSGKTGAAARAAAKSVVRSWPSRS